MAVLVIDAHAAIELVRRGHSRDDLDCELFAPTLLRSQVLAILHADLAAGGRDGADALELAEGACRLPRRLLGDAVLRKTAWSIASDHGWPETYDAEYVALTRLHGEALVAGSDALRERAAAIVRSESVDSFLARPGMLRSA